MVDDFTHESPGFTHDNHETDVAVYTEQVPVASSRVSSGTPVTQGIPFSRAMMEPWIRIPPRRSSWIKVEYGHMLEAADKVEAAHRHR
jgi:hypothetical protein